MPSASRSSTSGMASHSFSPLVAAGWRITVQGAGADSKYDSTTASPCASRIAMNSVVIAVAKEKDGEEERGRVGGVEDCT